MVFPRIYVVTGSNKGIGKSIVKLLLQDKEQKIVYLTSRNVENGEKAVKDLEEIGLKPYFHQLDITDSKSIECLRDFLVEKHGGLDVLVNNAGIAGRRGDLLESAKEKLNCNFFGTLTICELLFPVLKKNGRVVNVSSISAVNAYNKLETHLQRQFFQDITIESMFFFHLSYFLV